MAVPGRTAGSFARGLKNCRLMHIGSGIHYLQEDNPQAIGSVLHEWLIELEAAPDSRAPRVKN